MLKFYQSRADATFGPDFDISALGHLPEILRKYQCNLQEQSDFDNLTSSVGPRTVKAVLMSLSQWVKSVINYNSDNIDHY